MVTVLTYGTFDLFHIGHLNMLKNLSALGDRLLVGVSTDEFNLKKGKQSIFSFEERMAILQANRYVDLTFAEDNWQQKKQDVINNEVDIFAIGEDWKGEFDFLSEFCEVRYLPRTPYVSTTDIKASLQAFKKDKVKSLRRSLDDVLTLVEALE